MEKANLKELIRNEYIICAKDPVHFLKKYAYIQHPQKGRIGFHLFPFQEKVLNLWVDNNYTIINKSRQLGISTLAAGYSLWLMLFHKDKNILCIATKQETARNMVTKVKFMFDNLPTWLKIPVEENNKLSLRFNNGSIIKATSAASDAGRSESVSLLLVDEAAFIENIGEIWASAQQTLATGGKSIVISTPYGTGNWFHKTFVAAEEQTNNFLPIKLPWYVHPERDQIWRDRQDELLGDPRIAAQECDASFNTSGDTVFHHEWIDYIRNNTVQDPLERRGVDQNLWIWEPVDYTKEYLIVADVARGDGKDYSACHVIDVLHNVQVAEYKGQLPPKEFGYFLVGLASEYNNGLLVVENAGVGWSTLDSINEREYRNLYYSPKSDILTADSYARNYESYSDLVPGFSINQRNRPLIINKLREFVGEKLITIKSKRTLEEIKTFIWTQNGRAEAQKGYNDDLIMALGIGMFLRDTSLRFHQQNLDTTRSALNNMKKQNTNFYGGYSSHNTPNPYSIKTDKGQEDIKWLF
jgi:hypothetical protein